MAELPAVPYGALNGGHHDSPAPLPWRLATVASGVLACFFNAGLIFGYSAIYPELVANGAFRDRCRDDDGAAAVSRSQACPAQTAALTAMFTLATSLLNVLGVLGGAALDRLGPRSTGGGAALLVALGSGLFATGGPGAWDLAYNGGFLLMGVAGPVVFVSCLSFANLFPGKEGLVTAALVGCFDASSAVFIGLDGLLRRGLGLPAAFGGYALVPAATALAALLLWPGHPVPPAKAGGEEELVPRGLAALPLGRQLQSGVYALLVWNVSVGMVCLNFFIATCDLQLLRADPVTTSELGRTFSFFLPLGGVVYIPLVGFVVDRLGPCGGWLILWASFLLFFLLNVAYTLTAHGPLALASFAVFAWCRPLFYTLNAAFTGRAFGFANFGLLYGLMNTLAGLANGIVQPLQALAESSPSGFMAANGPLLLAALTTLGLPLLALHQGVFDGDVSPRKGSACSSRASSVEARGCAFSLTSP